jgi:putative sterol carrier protein
VSDVPSDTLDLSQADAEQLARVVAEADEEQLEQLMSSELRPQILDDVFRRMADHVEPEKAKGTDAVIHFKILDRPGGGYDHYEVVLDNGRCTVSERPERSPRVTFRVGPVEFLKLVSGNVGGPALFMTGQLRIEGDLLFAATMTRLFRVPGSGGA